MEPSQDHWPVSGITEAQHYRCREYHFLTGQKYWNTLGGLSREKPKFIDTAEKSGRFFGRGLLASE